MLRQLKAIRDSGKTVKEFVEDAKTSGQRISGLGHRVYKSYDPRAAIAKKYLQKIMERADTLKLPADERALFDVATELEKIALNDEYFVSRHLYSECRLLHGIDLSRDRVRSVHVHHIVCIGAYSRLDRAVS